MTEKRIGGLICPKCGRMKVFTAATPEGLCPVCETLHDPRERHSPDEAKRRKKHGDER